MSKETQMNWFARLMSQLFGSEEKKRKAKEQAIIDAVLPTVQAFATKVVGDVAAHTKINDETKAIVTGIVGNAINNFNPKA